jgi:hypothetical protein
MRRLAVVATLVVLASAVGAESIIKAVQDANLPKGTVTVEEVETVVAVASALSNDTLNAANPSDKPTQDLAYAMH